MGKEEGSRLGKRGGLRMVKNGEGLRLGIRVRVGKRGMVGR